MGMSLRVLAIGATGAIAAFVADSSGLVLALWLLVFGAGYLASLFVHPLRDCWSCRGTGRHTGMIFDYARRPCTRCAGSGARPRLGARMMHIAE